MFGITLVIAAALPAERQAADRRQELLTPDFSDMEGGYSVSGAERVAEWKHLMHLP